MSNPSLHPMPAEVIISSDAEPRVQDLCSAPGVQEFRDSWWNMKAVLPYSFLSPFFLPSSIFMGNLLAISPKCLLPGIQRKIRNLPCPDYIYNHRKLTREEIMAIKVCRSDVWTECFRSSRKRATYLRKRPWGFVIFRERVLQSAWSIVQSLAKVMMSIMAKTVKAVLILMEYKRENAMLLQIYFFW